MDPSKDKGKQSKAQKKQFKAQEEQFIIEYFRQVRGELTTRVQINTNLILQKIVTCGAALGFLFSQKSVTSDSLVSADVQLLGFAIVPIIGMGYDMLIARNINCLHSLGEFIRDEIEILAPNLGPNLWEKGYGLKRGSEPKNHGLPEIYFLSLYCQRLRA